MLSYIQISYAKGNLEAQWILQVSISLMKFIFIQDAPTSSR